MPIYAKRINAAQRQWLRRYEELTGFEPLYQDDIDAGRMTFREAARANVDWYESHTSDMHLRIQDPIKGAPTYREF